MIRWLTIFIISFVLEGYVMASYTYFRNYTDQPVEIWYSQKKSVYRSPYETTLSFVPCRKELLPIKKRTWKQLSDSIPVVYSGSNVLITVPAHSTIMIPQRAYYDTSIFLKQGDRTDTVKFATSSGSDNRFQSKNAGFPVVWIHYYDFK